MKANDLFSGKMKTCPITRDGCGFLKREKCFKFKEPKDIKDIKYLKNGERRLKCPYIHRRSGTEQPEQLDWVGTSVE